VSTSASSKAGLVVGGVTPLSTVDWPGELAAVVFCQGCAWSCPYCHNAALRPAKPGERPWAEVLAWLETRQGLLDAVVFSGGEPLLQPQAVELLNALARSGRTVLVETNGSCDISVLAPEVIAIMDMKGPSSGESGKMDESNLERLRARDEVKFVIADRQDWTYMLCLLPRIDMGRNVVNVSPLFGGVAPAELARWMLEADLDARLNLQQHKYIWPPDARGV